jgi:hypothetical protein
LQQELRELRGKIEEQEHSVHKMSAQSAAPAPKHQHKRKQKQQPKQQL